MSTQETWNIGDGGDTGGKDHDTEKKAHPRLNTYIALQEELINIFKELDA